MLLDAITTVLRETLEAGVLVSLLASIGHDRRLRARWLLLALPAGLLAALAYAFNLGAISNAFDGVGQELLNALLQYLMSAALLVILALLRGPGSRVLPVAMALIVITAITREGAEILLFFSSYLRADDVLIRALTSGFVGLSVGLSVGVVAYLVLATLPARAARRAQALLLALICAGMAGQATQLLMQADWVASGAPLWNSTALLAEDSMLGQMAYAVFGYEATPSAAEVGAYAAALLLIAAVQLWPRPAAA